MGLSNLFCLCVCVCVRGVAACDSFFVALCGFAGLIVLTCISQPDRQLLTPPESAVASHDHSL